MRSQKKSSADKERTMTRTSCEKASRRLGYLITKAERLGLTTVEVAELPMIKRLVPGRFTSSKSTLLMIALILGGGLVLALLCAPCFAKIST